MVDLTLFWLLLIPAILSLAHVFIHPKLERGVDFKTAAVFAVIGLAISAGIMSIGFYVGKGSKTSDTELWNGYITNKDRQHGQYTHTYQCNCVQVCSGTGQNQTCSQVCQTCSEEHYTVGWYAYSTVGNFTIKELDTTSPSVWHTSDPAFYTQVKIGEPCATKHSYTNYIKAVPASLFRPASGELKARFAGQIPEYPDTLYGMWKVDRVLPIGVKLNGAEWNSKLSEALKVLGPQKQANVIIVITKSNDPTYAYALQDAWVNGKKNDIIVVIGAPDFPNKAEWVQVLTLTNNEVFPIKLRDDILELEQLTADSVIKIIHDDTLALHQRKSMKDFKYLEAEIDPPAWVLWVMAITNILAYVGFWGYLYKSSQGTQRYRRGW